jgi:NTE family protein
VTTPTAASPTSALAADESAPAADGLARPIDFDARYGAGANRGLVLGGGGIFFIAWQVAYLRELEARGLDLSEADIVVGTSAGSVVAGLLTGRRLRWFSTQLELLSKAPGLMSALAPASDLNPSQQRALNLFSGATDNRPETIHAIGYAALAADAAPAAKMRRSVAAALALRGWPSQALHISTVDTYTGERLILTSAAGVPATHAAAASVRARTLQPAAHQGSQVHGRRRQWQRHPRRHRQRRG